jgi:uncharacterized membrane protein
VFHVATWVFVLAASVMTIVSWRQGRLAPSGSFHFGLVLTGWGIFNRVEGLVDHQILGVHHVRDDLGGPLLWDLTFLGFGVLLVVGAWALHKRGAHVLESAGLASAAASGASPGASGR